MGEIRSSQRVLQQANLKEFFRDALEDAAGNQKLQADVHTMYYVVNLLTDFTRSEQLYQYDEQGVHLKPLALILNDALSARHAGERGQHLRRLGDVALFLSGIFPDQLAGSLVDVDYYIAMGGQAYETLHLDLRGSRRASALGEVYAELAHKFAAFVDALDEVAEAIRHDSDKDIMRLYQLWLTTRSKRVATKLRRLGIEPSACSGMQRSH